jgi:hypothetical protein
MPNPSLYLPFKAIKQTTGQFAGMPRAWVEDAREHEVCTIDPQMGNAMAVARLFAAAPDLLAAARLVLEAVQPGDGGFAHATELRAMEALRNAVAKTETPKPAPIKKAKR